MLINYYQTLGVAENANSLEIRSAYRKLARIFHPDVSPDPEAEKKFKEINRAYDTLSDPLKRADFDRLLHPEKARPEEAPTPPPGAEEGYAWQPEEEVTRTDIFSALSRVSAHIFVFALAGIIFEVLLYYVGTTDAALTARDILFGAIVGGAFGLFFGFDRNFDVEGYLGAGKLGRTFMFLRTVVESLAFAYFFSRIGSAIDQAVYHKVYLFTPLLAVVGVMLGSTFGSDGKTLEKWQTSQGKFNLFYTLVRGFYIGLIGATITILIGLTFVKTGDLSKNLLIFALSGFILGDIAGSIAPPNLAAYASYASASIRNTIIYLIIIVTLIFGLVFGTLFGPMIIDVFKSIF